MASSITICAGAGFVTGESCREGQIDGRSPSYPAQVRMYFVPGSFDGGLYVLISGM